MYGVRRCSVQYLGTLGTLGKVPDLPVASRALTVCLARLRPRRGLSKVSTSGTVHFIRVFHKL